MIEHNQNEALYNPSLRQLLHVAFKLAAAAGTEFNDLLKKNAELIGGRVHHNLLHKHILRIF